MLTFLFKVQYHHFIYSAHGPEKGTEGINLSYGADSARRSTALPPLSSLIMTDSPHYNITSNVEFLLDFVIAGFAKTGTTTLARNFFHSHPEIVLPRAEVHLLTKNEPPGKLVQLMYELDKSAAAAAVALPGRNKVIRGYKAPRDIGSFHVLDIYDTYFPNAKLIVGLRHPIEWFHSFYNFKLRDKKSSMPLPELLDGECLLEMKAGEERANHVKNKLGGLSDRGVCADLARYHVRLSWMGKTNISDPAEDVLLGPNRRYKLANRAPIRNPIFLYEVAQLGDKNMSRLSTFLNDLQQYLGLSTPFTLPASPKKIAHDKEQFDICEHKYKALREVLLKAGKEASLWITTYFLKHPDVHVSAPDYFQTLLRRWHDDPCESTAKR